MLMVLMQESMVNLFREQSRGLRLAILKRKKIKIIKALLPDQPTSV